VSIQKVLRIVFASLLVAIFGQALYAQDEGWVYIGEANVNGDVDHDRIEIGAGYGWFRAIQFRVERAPIEFYRVVVHYANGTDEEIAIRSRINPGERTRAIDLAGDKRVIESIEFWYAKAGYDRAKPKLRMFGRTLAQDDGWSYLGVANLAAFLGANGPAQDRLLTPSRIIQGPGVPITRKTDRAVKDLKSRIDSFTMSVTLSPVEQGQVDAGPGLRSILLYTSRSLRIEPHGIWPNGQPVSADARISSNEAEKVIDLLAAEGFFERGGKYYSRRVNANPIKYPPPAVATPYTPLARKDRHVSITLTVNDERWYTYYESLLDWSAQTAATLAAIRRVLQGEGSEVMAKMLEAMNIGR
jgi:hypothetical protein